MLIHGWGTVGTRTEYQLGVQLDHSPGKKHFWGTVMAKSVEAESEQFLCISYNLISCFYEKHSWGTDRLKEALRAQSEQNKLDHTWGSVGDRASVVRTQSGYTLGIASSRRLYNRELLQLMRRIVE